MKLFFTFLLSSICVLGFSQDVQIEKPAIDYGFRYFNTLPCGGCPVKKPGDKVQSYHPNSKFVNDTTLWEWREEDIYNTGNPIKVYDLKPPYKDTLIRNDGSVIEVPIWIKNPNWEKPENPL